MPVVTSDFHEYVKLITNVITFPYDDRADDMGVSDLFYIFFGNFFESSLSYVPDVYQLWLLFSSLVYLGTQLFVFI